MQWSPEDTQEFVRTINEETDRLTTLVGNLLDMSRIQVGALQPALSATPLEEVVPAAVMGLGTARSVMDVDVPETLPAVLADPALLERALANVIENAVHFSPPGHRVRVEAGAFGGRVDLRVIDRGPGISRENRERVFQPFQRLGDSPSTGGVGLGLAVAYGFVTAMGAAIDIDDTPGGGATVTISIPAAE
jgi:two-component system sensor histidine kinase KdpD